MIAPLLKAIESKMSVQGLPVAVDVEIAWEDGSSSVFLAGDPKKLMVDEDDEEASEVDREELIDDIADRIVDGIQTLMTHQPVAAAPKPSNN
jgi:hypothetical protein